MKKSYFIHLLFAAVALLFAANSNAQTFYVGTQTSMSSVSGASSGYQGRILSIDINDLSKASGEYCIIPTGSVYDEGEDYYVMAGATMGDAYYAITYNDFSEIHLYSMNMEADKATWISQCTGLSSTVSDMAYSPAAGQMFVLQQNSTTASTLYTLDVTDGSFTEYCTFDVSMGAIAVSDDGTVYGLYCGYMTGMTLYTIDLDAKTYELVFENTEDLLGGSVPTSNSMAYYDGKLYFLSGRLLFAIDPTTGDISTIDGTMCVTQASGLTFTKSTADVATIADDSESLTFYIGTQTSMSSVSGASSGWQGRILSIDINDLSKASGEYCIIPTGSVYDEGEDYYVMAGATMGDAYYAITYNDFSEIHLYSMNMEADKATWISQCTGLSSTVSDMAYSPAAGQMFVLQQNSTTASTLYTLDVTDGSFTEYCTFDVPMGAIAVSDDGTVYGLYCGYMTGMFLYTIDLDAKTYELVFEDTEDLLGGSVPTSNSMAYYDGKLYFLSGRLLFAIDPTTGDISTIDGTMCVTQASGLTFTKSTADIATIADDGSDSEGGDDGDGEGGDDGGSAGISGVTTDSDDTEVARYMLDGTRISSPVKGVNIVKKADGSIVKVIVK